jgi:hypothetical protein
VVASNLPVTHCSLLHTPVMRVVQGIERDAEPCGHRWPGKTVRRLIAKRATRETLPEVVHAGSRGRCQVRTHARVVEGEEPSAQCNSGPLGAVDAQPTSLDHGILGRRRQSFI